MEKRLKMNINTFDKVKSFVDCNSKLDGYVDVVSGRYLVDGKSLLGMFSLDLSKELEVVIDADSEKVIASLIESYKNNNLL